LLPFSENNFNYLFVLSSWVKQKKRRETLLSLLIAIFKGAEMDPVWFGKTTPLFIVTL
jgi:hypothetical protein